ncbi:hypothetical protein EV363DRAFT_1468924 [Boletus edulis]|nr:hypothetical protein EV363DRAFT_1468924 [Boletus edulis]
MSPNLITHTLNQLLLDVLHVVFYYIDIPDILRVRRVSRYLNKATRYRNVWVDAYHTAEFPRPPGPFLSQSVHDLENILITSFRVSQNLQRYCSGTAQRAVYIFKLREIRNTGINLHVNLIFGRFLLIASKEEIRCYDLNLDESDPNSGGSIIYRTTGRIMRSFHCVSAVDVEGRRFACAVLNEATQTTRRMSIYFLNVGKQSDITMDPVYRSPEYSTFDVQFVDLGPRVIVIQGRLGPNLDTDWRFIVLDVLTRTELLIPPFTHATWQAAEMPERRLVREGTLFKGISTSTHLVLARSFYTEAAGWSTFFQAFTLPTSHIRCSPPTSVPLSPSHHAVIPGINVRLFGSLLLHDAVLDASTQDVLIAIRIHTFESSRPRVSISQHGILRLSTTHTTRGQEVGTIAFQLLGPFSHSQMLFVHPSFNGVGRLFYLSSDRVIAALEYGIYAGGGSNGDHEHGAKVVDYPSLLQFPTPRSLMDYDPYSGRICLRYAIGNNCTFEIFDFST